METKIIVLIFLFFSFSAFGENCLVVGVIDNSVRGSYPSPCNQGAYSGAWGNAAITTHVLETTFRSQETQSVTDANTKDTKLQTIKTSIIACVRNWGTLTANQKDACILGLGKVLMSAQLSSSDL